MSMNPVATGWKAPAVCGIVAVGWTAAAVSGIGTGVGIRLVDSDTLGRPLIAGGLVGGVSAAAYTGIRKGKLPASLGALLLFGGGVGVGALLGGALIEDPTSR